MKLVVGNSFSRLEGADLSVDTFVSKVLTYEKNIEHESKALYFKLKTTKWKIKKFNGVDEDEYQKAQDDKRSIEAAIRRLNANKKVCWYRKGVFPTGHLNIVVKALEHLKVEYTLEDQRVKPKPDLFFKWQNPPHKPRYYQQEAVDAFLKEGRGVINACIGSGKTLMSALCIKALNVNTLVIVPSSGLSQQIYDEYSLWFGVSRVEIVDTRKIRSGKSLKPIRIITYQSFASLIKSKEAQKLVKDINFVVIDEYHHAGSVSFTSMMPELNHVYYRLGQTGTFTRTGGDELDMWGLLSNVVYRYKASKATEEGFLTPIKKVVHQLAGTFSPNYQKEYDANYCGNPDLMLRIEQIIRKAGEEQVLILVNKKDKSGHLIHDYLNLKGLDNTFISGDNSKEEINKAIKAFNNGEIRVLIGSAVIGEGIDIRSADHLILAQGGKSEISIVQAIGRLVRLAPNKSVGILHDFRFTDTKFMEKHFLLRARTIKEEFAPRETLTWEDYSVCT